MNRKCPTCLSSTILGNGKIMHKIGCRNRAYHRRQAIVLHCHCIEYLNEPKPCIECGEPCCRFDFCEIGCLHYDCEQAFFSEVGEGYVVAMYMAGGIDEEE